ncbi:hypothetical protein PIROE2DRAFT_64362 [Piromyces sp. E2]|nr:hypothetical protein PIROE2DRAFT_64362 [Piromyces sp. E2]|eukprot:OUM58502.1 hypothetical protein PIROE2DRAFT_64362 [Piromyces sp. E2]
MKYTEEETLLSNIQNKFNNDIYQSKNIKLSNNKLDLNSKSSSQKLSKQYILPKEKPLKSPVERPLKSPRRLECTNAAANRLYQLHTQRNIIRPVINNKTTTKSKINSKSHNNNNININLLNELVNTYNGFTHKFTNENSSIRAYKTIGHTTLSFASIISMKNRPLLDRKVINESNLRKKKELQLRQIKAQEQKKKRNEQLNNQKLQTDKIIDTVHTKNPHQNNSQKNVDNDVKIEVIRTLSVSEEGRLSTESLESLKSIDYFKIEDIINEYIITPDTPETPTRYNTNQDNSNSLNHLYDAYNYFHNDNLKQYIAWIPLNNKKECLSASSLLAKKHAPIVFKKTITHPKRVSSLYANFIHNDKNDIIQTKNTQNSTKPPTKSLQKNHSPHSYKEESEQKPTSQIKIDTKSHNNTSNNSPTPVSSKVNTAKSLHAQIVDNIMKNKSQKMAEQKSPRKEVKSDESKKVNRNKMN